MFIIGIRLLLCLPAVLGRRPQEEELTDQARALQTDASSSGKSISVLGTGSMIRGTGLASSFVEQQFIKDQTSPTPSTTGTTESTEHSEQSPPLSAHDSPLPAWTEMAEDTLEDNALTEENFAGVIALDEGTLEGKCTPDSAEQTNDTSGKYVFTSDPDDEEKRKRLCHLRKMQKELRDQIENLREQKRKHAEEVENAKRDIAAKKLKVKEFTDKIAEQRASIVTGAVQAAINAETTRYQHLEAAKSHVDSALAAANAPTEAEAHSHEEHGSHNRG